MTRARIAIVPGLAAIAMIAAAALHPHACAAQTPRFSEQLTVHEREILVELPDDLLKKPLKPGDFQVLVDGQPREVTRAEPLASPGEPPWTIVIYIDRVLASPATVFYSSLALAHRARELTGLGAVEVIVADSDPRQALASTREAQPLERMLSELSAAARRDRDRKDLHPASPAEPDAAQLRRQLDKLQAFADRPPAGPHAILLVTDGPKLSDEELAGLDRGSPAAPQSAAAAIQSTARRLAAGGWVAIPVPLREEDAGSPASMQSDVETLRQNSAGSPHGSLPPTISFAPAPTSSLSFRGVIDLMILPRAAALRALARPTAGTVIGFEVQLDEVLAALRKRWRLWIAEPEAPGDGRLHSLAVKLQGRRGTLRAPEWLRSGEITVN